MSASHIIQTGSDLFIGKDEAYIISRKKKEKPVLRKKGNVHVLDLLFVKVPSGAAAPIKYKPMEVGAVDQVADERAQRKRVAFDCSNTTFLMAGGVEDRSKRTETVRHNLVSVVKANQSAAVR